MSSATGTSALRRRLIDGLRRNIVAWIALFVALSGTAYAASITSSMIVDNTIRSRDVMNGTLTSTDISRSTIAAFVDTTTEIVSRVTSADGAGSGLDADLVDGLDSSQLVESGNAVRALLPPSQSITSGTSQDVVFSGGESYDTASMHDLVTNPERFYAPTNGLYLVTVTATWQSDGTGARILTVLVNGSGVVADQMLSTAAGNEFSQSATDLVSLNAGDYVSAQVRQTTAGNQLLWGSGSTFLSMAWVAPKPN